MQTAANLSLNTL